MESYMAFCHWLIYHVFKVHLCYQCFIPLYGQKILHCMDIPLFFIHSSAALHLDVFHRLAITNYEYSCMNINNLVHELWTLISVSVQFSHSVMSDFATPWIAARQASLSITNSQSSLKLTSIESVMPSSHLILCCPLLLLPPVLPSIRVFSNESMLHTRWPKYWSFSFSIIPSKEHQCWSPLEWTGWISLQSKGLSRVFSNTTVQKHQFFGAQLSL